MATKKVHVLRLAHVVYQHPDLEKALRFLFDFGFVEVERTNGRVYLRGYGKQPILYVAEQSPDTKRHFMGGYWVVNSQEDLEIAAAYPTASPIKDSDAPGGGKVVTLEDPNGFTVGFVYGQTLRDAEGPTPLEKTTPITNQAIEKNRKGTFRRFKPGACPVHKLGHYGYIVPRSRYDSTYSFYMGLMNLKPSDTIYDPKTGDDENTFFHIDLGAEYVDHHSIFIGAGPEERPAHVHHSSFEVNDIDTQTLGHDWLRSKGWTNCWGIGRHVLGSQIFDYWFDGSGNVLEHYSDGDLVNEDKPYAREPAAADSLHIWGPNVPLAILTARIEDAGIDAPMPPDVLESKPAQYGAAAVAAS